ncbi:MAG: NDP-hexose 2,3-dehydratase family protein [Pseudomonadota bacterium]
MTVGKTKAELDQVLGLSKADFQLKQVPSADAPQWAESEGKLQHESGGYFSCVGISSATSEHIMLYQPQSAITGLLRARHEDGERYLLQARAEPGCINSAQFGPTVQSTPANIQRAHGGSAPPFIERFMEGSVLDALVDDTSQLDLGERYLHKCKRSILLETEQCELEDQNYVWATVPALLEGLATSTFFNIDLRSILAISNWSPHIDELTLGPISTLVVKSLQKEVREQLLGSIIKSIAAGSDTCVQLLPIDQLKNWSRTKMGWQEIEHSRGYAVEFYSVKANFREINSWVQPLINSQNTGEAVLACRVRQGSLELFVKPMRESGIRAGVLGPSHIRYPGSAIDRPDWLETTARTQWISTLESDEGGRFFQDATHYRLVWVEEGCDIDEQGYWISVAELKALLRISNTASIQLRALASLLLAAPDE